MVITLQWTLLSESSSARVASTASRPPMSMPAGGRGGPCLQLEFTLMRRRRRFKANTLSRAAQHRCLRESAPPPRPPLSSVERRRTSETRKHAAVSLRPCSESELIREHFSFVSPSLPPAAEGPTGRRETNQPDANRDARRLVTPREWQRAAESFVSMEMR